MRKINSALAVVLLLILFACGGKQSEDQIVSVTIEPQRYVTEKIAGDRFVIHTAVPIGQSPEAYDPTPQQMLRLGKSVAYFRIGAIGFEQAWMPGIVANNPDLKVFDLSEGFELIHETEEHHDHQGHHHHGGSDPHIWSSVGGMRTIAWNTLNAFLALDKEHTAYYWQNYNQLLSEIDETEAIIKERLSPLAGDAFIIYHPALTYFAEEFGLLQFCIEMDGKEPSPARLKELISTAREHHAKVVFIQQEFDSKNAELIAKETDCRLVVINPLSYEWNKEMIHIAKALAGE